MKKGYLFLNIGSHVFQHFCKLAIIYGCIILKSSDEVYEFLSSCHLGSDVFHFMFINAFFELVEAKLVSRSLVDYQLTNS